MASTAITVENLTKRFRLPGAEGEFMVIESISLTVDEGKFVSIVGPSGCGKSTLLNIIAGIETYDGGSVTVSPRAGGPAPEPRVAYVFQSPAVAQLADRRRATSNSFSKRRTSRDSGGRSWSQSIWRWSGSPGRNGTIR